MRSVVNYKFYTNRLSETPHRAPRISDNFAQKYLRNLERGTTLKWQLSGHTTTFTACTDSLGPLRPWMRCEKYLINAVSHWLADRLDSHTSLKRYVAAFVQWVRATGLRRLDHQCEVSYRYLSEYRDDLVKHWAPRSINTHLQILRSWFTWLRDLGMIEKSPWRADLQVNVDKGRLYHANRVGHTRRRLTSDEAINLLRYAWNCAPRQCLALVLMVAAGLRRSEVRDLDHSDLFCEGETRCMSVRGKGKKTRTLPLEGLVISAIDRHLNHRDGSGRPVITGPLLRRPNGEALHLNTIAYWVRRAGKAIGRPDLTPHELRRTYATLLRDRGAPLETTQLMLGHSSAALTQDFYDVGDRRWTGGTGLVAPSKTA